MSENVESAMTSEERYELDLRSGLWIFILLVIFTAGEYLAAVFAPTLGWLLLIVALPKAYFVITEYMHIHNLWQPETEEEL